MTRTVTSLLATILLITLTGCAGQETSPRTATPATGSAASALPSWVRMASAQSDGRDTFVGGCSIAESPEAAIKEASADVFAQIGDRAKTDFTAVYVVASRACDAELTSIDRLDFREGGIALYGSRMADASSLDRVYLQDCETGQAYEGIPAEWAGGSVCKAFVQRSLDAKDWERVLEHTILEMRHEFVENGRENLVELADWMATSHREVLEQKSAGKDREDKRENK